MTPRDREWVEKLTPTERAIYFAGAAMALGAVAGGEVRNVWGTVVESGDGTAQRVASAIDADRLSFGLGIAGPEASRPDVRSQPDQDIEALKQSIVDVLGRTEQVP